MRAASSAITINNEKLANCVWSLVKVFLILLIAQRKKSVSEAQGGQENIFTWDRGYLCHIANQPVSQSKMAPNAWNCMASWSIALGLVRKTLESDFPKNDTISMRSPSSNASISRGNIFSQELTAACKSINRALSCERNRNKGVRFQGNRLCGYQIF